MAESSFLNPQKIAHAAGLHEGMKVADFGAGSGFFTRAAARMVGQGGVVWAVDIHRDMLPRLKSMCLAEGLHNVEVVHGDVSHIGGSNLPEATFDVVLVCNMLFTVECRSCVAAEAARVLKIGGRVVVVDWSGSHGGLGPHTEHVVSMDATRQLFEEHGFVWGEEIPAGAYHWGCILKKKKSP